MTNLVVGRVWELEKVQAEKTLYAEFRQDLDLRPGLVNPLELEPLGVSRCTLPICVQICC